jgi:hypothetical protein
MCERLDVGEDEDPEVVRRRFDVELQVKRWRRTVDDTDRYSDAVIEESAPWWWEGEAEASDSFLAAMGVSL